LKGCTCKPGPSYYVFHRDHDGKAVKGERVRDRQVAERALRKKQVEIDEGRVGLTAAPDRTFPEWADEYEAILKTRPGLKDSTRDAYRRTLKVARDEIGHVQLRKLAAADIRRFQAHFADVSPATQSKQLRHLAACLSAAVDEGLMDRNPVGPFKKSLRLRVPAGTPPYTDGELAALLAALANPVQKDGTVRAAEPVYVAIVRAAATTGARIGEMIALRWEDLNLADGKLRIRRTFDRVTGTVTLPKDNEERTVHLTPGALDVFGEWVKVAGVQTSGVVFPPPRGRGYLSSDWLRDLVNAALDQAGIQKVDPLSGRPRKPFHSLRATFARQQLEQGKNPQWVERQLGHSSLTLTIGVYGAWSDEAMLAEAARTAPARA
jgi:integrase